MILGCSCKSPQQDKIHGNGRRVFNPVKKKQGDRQVYRCTVCTKEQSA